MISNQEKYLHQIRTRKSMPTKMLHVFHEIDATVICIFHKQPLKLHLHELKFLHLSTIIAVIPIHQKYAEPIKL